MKISTEKILIAYLFFSLVFFSNVFNGLLSPAFRDEISRTEETNFIAQFIKFPFYFVILFAFSKSYRGFLSWVMNYRLFAIFSALVLFSTIWSLEPAKTFPRSLFLIFSIYSAIFMFYALGSYRALRLLNYVFITLALITLISIIVFPSISIHHDMHYPSVRGLFSHKNVMGRLFVLGFFLSLYCLIVNRFNMVDFIALFLSLSLVILSLSGTSVSVLLFSFLVFLILLFIHKFKSISYLFVFSVYFLFPIFFFFFYISGYFDSVLSSFNKDPTFTGRTFIWQTLINDVLPNEPLLGYGYRAFWSSYYGTYSFDWGLGEYVPPSAHNGFLQTAVDIGIFGFVIVISILANFLKKSLNGYFITGSPFYVFTLSFFTCYFVINIFEVFMFDYGELSVVLFTILYCSLYSYGKVYSDKKIL